MTRRSAVGDLPIHLAALWCVLALVGSSCTEMGLALQRRRYDYQWERQKCLTLTNDEEREICLGDVEKAEKVAAYPGYFVSERSQAKLKTERQAFQENEREQLLARCRSATDSIRSAFRDGKFGEAYRITQESKACPQADEIRATFLEAVRRLSPQQVAAQRNEDVARIYWRPIELFDWMTAANRGTFITDRGVYLMGLVEQQFDGYAILHTNTDQRVALRLDRPRYLRREHPLVVIGRFAELGPFTTAIGARVDIPVFDIVYDESR